MQFLDQQKEVCSEIGQDYTIIAAGTHDLYSITEIKRWINMAKDWALSYKKWPFLEAKGTDLIDATGNYPYSTLMKTKSCFLITVAGERFVKINYEDYLKYLEEFSSGDNKVWAEFDRTIYINGNACSVGDAVLMYGQIGVIDLVGDTTTTPFADAEPSGDEAVIKKAVSLALRKDKKRLVESTRVEAEAKDILNAIWDRLQEAKPREVRKARPMFKRINIIKGTTRESNRDNIGRF